MRIALAAIILATGISPSFATLSEEDRLMGIAYTEWAGTNCGQMVSLDDFGQALALAEEEGKEKMAPYRRRVRAMMDKAHNLEIACQSIKDAMAEAGK